MKNGVSQIAVLMVAATLFSFSILDVKAQEAPVLEWAKSMGNALYYSDAKTSIAVDALGNVYQVGYFGFTIDFDPGPGTYNLTPAGPVDIFIVKLDANGNFVWAKSMGGTSIEYGNAIAVDAAGNIYTTGTFYGTADFDPGTPVFNLTPASVSFSDIFISKLDTDGNFVWAKSMGGNGVGDDAAYSITIDPSGNILTTGEFYGTADFDPGVPTFNLTSSGFSDIFVSKLDSDGNFIWARKMGGANNSVAYAIASDALGNVFTTGSFLLTADFDPGAGVFNLTSAGNSDIFISKLDVNGNFVWAKAIGSTNYQHGHAIAIDQTGNVYTIGTFNVPVDFDPGPGVFTLSPPSTYGTFISKLDNAGNFVWAKATGGDSYTKSTIALDNTGNMYITGGFMGTTDFDPGPGVYNLVANLAAPDIFITKLDQDGNFIWARGTGGNVIGSNDSGTSIAIDPTGYIFVSGGFQNTADVDFSACTFNITSIVTSTINSDLFILKMSIGSVIPPPAITSFSPSSGPVGTSVTITGSNFSTTPTNNAVKFNTTNATVSASTSTTIETTVPTGSTTGKISVTVGCVTVQSATNFIVGAPLLPTITSFAPTSGPVGTVVIITGTNFSTTPSSNVVNFNGTPATVTASTATSITTTVPAGATTGKITVTVAGNTATSIPDFTVTAALLPTITSFTPTSGPIGTTVNITGTNFSTTPSNNAVKFNGTSATVTTSSATSITVTVPTGATTGTITVTVAGNTATSATNFTVTVTPIITITTQPTQASVCDGATAGFTTTATGTTNITYQWQFSPNGPPAFADIVNGPNYSGAATNSLSINTTGGFGEGRYRCRINGDLATEVITNDEGLFVSPIPPAPGTTGNSGCNSASVSLTASGGVNGQYRWYTTASGGTALPGEVNSTYLTPTLSSTTTYYPSINNGTCEGPRTPVTATINVVSKPLVVTSNCTTSSATLSGPGGFTTYAWSNSATTQSIVVSTAGSYTLVVTAANGCVSPPSDATTLTSTFCNQPPLIANTAISTVTEGIVTLSISELLSDPDDNLDLSTLTVVTQPTSGAIASIGPNATLTIDYKGKPFAGKDELTLGVCDLSGVCTESVVAVDVAGEIIVNNGISPNGDAKNDAWIIQYIDVFPETKVNHVSLFNRWGDAVFETDNYDNVNRVFKGVNTGGNELPTGTYFYKIEFASGRKTMTGYLSLKR